MQSLWRPEKLVSDAVRLHTTGQYRDRLVYRRYAALYIILCIDAALGRTCALRARLLGLHSRRVAAGCVSERDTDCSAGPHKRPLQDEQAPAAAS
jgi:hypothetical protein